MRLTTRLLAAFNRRAWRSEGHVFAFTPEQIGMMEGLRASFAVAVMLSADLLLNMPDFAFGAVAAFWTCLCDPGGPDRSRLKSMATFALSATLAISVAAYCAHWGTTAAGMALFVLVLLCGLTRSYRPTFGPMPAPIGLIAAVAVVVGVTSPRSAVGALELAGCFLLGSSWAAILCLYLWRTDPQAPVRRALVSVFARLGDMVLNLERLDRQTCGSADEWLELNGGHRRAVRLSIERGREMVARTPAAGEHFNRSIDAAGHVFAALMAVAHHRAGRKDAFDPTTERPLLERLRHLLHLTASQLERTERDPESLLREATRLLNDTKGRHDLLSRANATAAKTLVELGHYWQEPETWEPSKQAAASLLSLKIPALVWRQALRVASAVLASYAIGACFDVTFSYWGTIATLVLMQPMGANTWLRVVERAAGSIIGGVLTAILTARLSGPVEMLLFIAPLSAAVIALRLVNYGLFVVFITPMFVLVSDFIHPTSNLISARAINEVIGACIGLAGSVLLWPEKEGETLSDAVLAAISANLAFASGMLRGETDTSGNLDALRREAGLTSSRAEVARQRLLLEGRSRRFHLDRLHEILVALRTMCGAVNVAAIMRQSETEQVDKTRADRYDALARCLREEILGRDERAEIAALVLDHHDDLGHAKNSLVTAVQDYTAETYGMSNA